MTLFPLFIACFVCAIAVLVVVLWRYGASRAFLLRVFSKFKFSLRTLLLATLALGASGVAYLHWNPFVPTGQATVVEDLAVTHATIEFSPDGRQLLYTTHNNVFLWDLDATHRRLETKPALGHVWGARFSDDGASIVAFSQDKIVRFALTGEVQNEIADVKGKAPQDEARFQSTAVRTVSSNGRYALVEEATHIRTANGGEGRLSDTPQILQVLDCATGKTLVSFPSGFSSADTAGISEDGRRICWESNRSGQVKLAVFDLGASQPREMQTDSLHSFQGKLVLTRDRRMTAFACSNHGVEVLDLDRMQALERVDIPGVQAAFLSPDGSRLATVHDLKSIAIWESRRKPGAFGPLDFPELWLAIAFGAFFFMSLIVDRFALRRSRPQTASPDKTASPVQTANPPVNLSPRGAE